MGRSLWVGISLSVWAAYPQSNPEAILKQRCYGCHGSAQQMSGLRLDRPDEIRRVASRIIPRVTGAPGLVAMPPAGPRLTADEVRVLREWLDQFAPKKKHWAFEPVRKPQPGETI